MTQPVEPTPGAPAAEPTPQPAPPPETPAEDIGALPEWAQKAIKDARAEAGKARTTAKQNAAEEARAELTAQLAKALGLGGDEPVDPAKLTEQIEAAQNQAWRSGVELEVFRTAGSLGANAEALLDSLKFIDSLDELVEMDPRSPEFRQALQAKVQEAVATNPGYRATGQAPAATTPRPDPSQGSRGSAAQPFTGRSLTDAIRSHYATR